LHKFWSELCVVILFDIIDTTIVTLVEKSVVLVQFSVPTHSFAQTIAFWAS